MATYVEGNSLHPERGGASTFARYAFDELWSFVAGWAILLDYLIVMAIGGGGDHRLPGGVLGRRSTTACVEIVIGGARARVRGAARTCAASSAERLGMVLRLSLFGHRVCWSLVAAIALRAGLCDPGAITDSIELGSAPAWDDAALRDGGRHRGLTGIEAASGLAGEVRVGRRGLRRVVLVVRGVGAGAVRRASPPPR